MEMDHKEQLGEGLIYEDLLPLTWVELEGEIKPVQVIRTQDENEEAFRFITAMEEKRSEAADDASSGIASELARIEFKLNLLFDMVSRLLEQQVEKPPLVSVSLSPTGMMWEADNVPTSGSYVQIDLYINRRYPRPITLYGHVQDIQKTESGFRILVLFEQMSDLVRGHLEKLIFRHHRRYVAFSRQAVTNQAEGLEHD